MAVTETTLFKTFSAPTTRKMPLHPKVYNITAPAAGAFVNIVVPTKVVWKPILIHTTYTSDSTVLARQIYIDLFDEDNLLITRFGAGGSTGITASLAGMHVSAMAFQGNAAQVGGANIVSPIPLPNPDYFLLKEGWTLQIGSVSGSTPMPAADQFGATRIYVDEIPVL